MGTQSAKCVIMGENSHTVIMCGAILKKTIQNTLTRIYHPTSLEKIYIVGLYCKVEPTLIVLVQFKMKTPYPTRNIFKIVKVEIKKISV